MDFRTAKKKELDQRNKNISSDYISLLNEPGATPNAVYRVLSERYGMTIPGIIWVLKRENVFNPSAS